MYWIYRFILCLYYYMIHLAAIGNSKAKAWIQGRKTIGVSLTETIKNTHNIIWFHCPSLGEFEQGRPLMELIKRKNPESKILLTFFSPSGYEIRKNYAYADFVLYLPHDNPKNAKSFINMVKPEKVFFIKYDFWYHFLYELHKQNIPLYLVSAVFRKEQIFFRWYGSWYRKMLHFFSHIFVQDQASRELLATYHINNVSVCGDTRFDRVQENALHSIDIPQIEQFCNNKFVLIAGSTWPADEKLICRYINEHNISCIIAPHEIHTSHIKNICDILQKKVLLFSEIKNKHISEADVLIMDNIGMLSSIYKYGKVAYVGGGFGAGIHNTLEPAVYGMPVIFGPRYEKFHEAKELIHSHAAISIKNYSQLKNTLDRLISDKHMLDIYAKNAKNYVQEHTGATKCIFSHTMKKA